MDTIRLRELYITGAMAFVVLITYCTLTTLSLLNWNGEVSGALVTGFALLAKDVVSKMFQLHADRNAADAAATTVPTKAA